MDKDYFESLAIDIAVILLSIVSLFMGAGYGAVLCACILLVLATFIGFVNDKKFVHGAIEIIAIAIWAAFTTVGFTYMVIPMARSDKRLACALAPIATVVDGIVRGTQLSRIIINVAATIVFETIFMIIYVFAKKYSDIKLDGEMSLTRASINEMKANKANQELILSQNAAERNARMAEREEISRSIHNSVGHSITAAIMTLDAADMLYDAKPELAREKMQMANERMRGSLENIRSAVRVLDAEGGTVLSDDFKKSISIIVDEFVMDTPIKVHINDIDLPDNNEIPSEHTEFLTSTLRELLTNGRKHGNADEYIVIVSGDSRHVRLSVKDNGTSDYDESNAAIRIENGFGLKKTIAHVKKCGGSIKIDNENGFKVAIEIPYELEVKDNE